MGGRAGQERAARWVRGRVAAITRSRGEPLARAVRASPRHAAAVPAPLTPHCPEAGECGWGRDDLTQGREEKREQGRERKRHRENCHSQAGIRHAGNTHPPHKASSEPPTTTPKPQKQRKRQKKEKGEEQGERKNAERRKEPRKN